LAVPVCEACSEWPQHEEGHYEPWPCDYIEALQAIYPETAVSGESTT
jgi:hypothetical protein